MNWGKKLYSHVRHPRKFRGDFIRWIDHSEYIDGAINKHLAEESRNEDIRRDYEIFCEQLTLSSRGFACHWEDRLLCRDDNTGSTQFDSHYVYHPAWAARVLATTRPERHSDFSSSLHFCTMISAFIPVDFYDFRPAPIHLTGLWSTKADLTSLETIPDGCLGSVSCMHVIEHIGLGRYGDAINPNADLAAIRELIRVTKPGGDLLIVVPVGRKRIIFNAHRIYDHREFVSHFQDMELREFALIPDGAAPDGLLINPQDGIVNQQSYGCGCYWFRKALSA